MIFDYKIFFETYQKDYHFVKANILKKMIDDKRNILMSFLELD